MGLAERVLPTLTIDRSIDRLMNRRPSYHKKMHRRRGQYLGTLARPRPSWGLDKRATRPQTERGRGSDASAELCCCCPPARKRLNAFAAAACCLFGRQKPRRRRGARSLRGVDGMWLAGCGWIDRSIDRSRLALRTSSSARAADDPLSGRNNTHHCTVVCAAYVLNPALTA